MKNIKFGKIFLTILGSLATSLFFAGKAMAMCPLCTVIVGAGVIAAEDKGVDLTIIGIWVGALTISMIGWTMKWLSTKKFNFKYSELVIVLVYFILLPVGLYMINQNPNLMPETLRPKLNLNATTLWGIDKMILGMILGSIVFYAASILYEGLKRKNGGKAHFPFERIAIPVAAILIISGAFWIITK